MWENRRHAEDCCLVFTPHFVFIVTVFRCLLILFWWKVRVLFLAWNINMTICRTDKHHASVAFIFLYQITQIYVPSLRSLTLDLFSPLSSRFVSPQTGSSSRYMGQQNSPVPSPYTPQSPATGYIQPFPHQQPPSYNQHQQIQQGRMSL